MTNITEKNVREFINAIKRDSLEESNRILRESEDFRKREYEEAKKRIKKNSVRETQAEITKIKTQTNREISALVNETKKDVVLKREKITEQVMDLAGQKLLAFTESEEYADFLVKSAFKIKEALKADDITFFLREKDMAFKDIISDAMESKCTFCVDNSIKTGGLIGKTKNVIADDTLDERLSEQYEWFKANSGLTVR